MKLSIHLKGGEGSGNFGHAGRPGEQGGSGPGGGSDVNSLHSQYLPEDVEAKRFFLHAIDNGWASSKDLSGAFTLSKPSKVAKTRINIRFNPDMGFAGRYTVYIRNYDASVKRFTTPDDAFKYAKRLLDDRHFFTTR